jgi:hypothetical protein
MDDDIRDKYPGGKHGIKIDAVPVGILDIIRKNIRHRFGPTTIFIDGGLNDGLFLIFAGQKRQQYEI